MTSITHHNTNTHPSLGWDGMTSITRRLTFDPDLSLLLLNPVKELSTLHAPVPLVDLSALAVPPAPALGPAPLLGEDARGPYLDVEVEVTFEGVEKMPHGRLVLTVLAAKVRVRVS